MAECAETQARAPPRGAKCNFTVTPEVLRLSRRLTFGHPNPHKSALARAVCAKVRARAPQNAKKRTFGGPRVPKGAKMEPKWRQIGAQNVPKLEVSKKSAESGLDLLFTIYNHYRHPAKTSLFDTSKQPKCRSFPRGASDAAPGLQNGAHGAEKWREWGPPGSPRLPKGLPMPPKMLPKKHQKSALLLPGCLGYPTAPKIPPFLTFPRPAFPQVGGTFHLPLPLCPAPHSPPLI